MSFTAIKHKISKYLQKSIHKQLQHPNLFALGVVGTVTSHCAATEDHLQFQADVIGNEIT